MFAKAPSLAVYAILAATVVVAAQAPAGDAKSVIPTVGKFYALPQTDMGSLRVAFEQKSDVLSGTWMTPDGEIYGRGEYRWDATAGCFAGISTTVNHCLADDGRTESTFQYQVREQLFVVNERELRDRFTKPLDVDCSVGLVEKFKWDERQWMATDKDWKPLAPRSGGGNQ